MKTGRWYESAEYRKFLADEKAETIAFVKEMTEKQIVDPTPHRKRMIDLYYEHYKWLAEQK